jgi:hypothetical protein
MRRAQEFDIPVKPCHYRSLGGTTYRKRRVGGGLGMVPAPQKRLDNGFQGKYSIITSLRKGVWSLERE